MNEEFEKALEQCRHAQIGESIKIPLHDGSYAIWTVENDGHPSVTFPKSFWDKFIREETLLPRNKRSFLFHDPVAHESTLFQNPRQATTKNNPGKLEDAGVVSRLKLREGLPRSLTPLERLRRSLQNRKELRVLPPLKDARSRQKPKRSPQKRKAAFHYGSPASFDKVEFDEPANGWKAWRKRIQLESIRD